MINNYQRRIDECETRTNSMQLQIDALKEDNREQNAKSERAINDFNG